MRPCQGRDRGFESRRDRQMKQLDDIHQVVFYTFTIDLRVIALVSYEARHNSATMNSTITRYCFTVEVRGSCLCALPRKTSQNGSFFLGITLAGLHTKDQPQKMLLDVLFYAVANNNFSTSISALTIFPAYAILPILSSLTS